ncbi:MAG TPA: YggS family pyridoxal phosphate-dependent enzyme [Candidatus Polarisedimenticolia bacterium]|nr:YggS family pyridoxal phosphate-dependent enzyme [Candidatus Polarisedimenticolia bacterium]
MRGAIALNLQAVRRRIAAAAARAGRSPADITLIGVSKTMSAERVQEAIGAGLMDLGENRVQEARDKIAVIGGGARWHLVGHLQGNKANLAARLFNCVHSIDTPDLLRRLEAAAGREGRHLEALVQVDLAGEQTKFGADEAALEGILAAARECRSIAVCGLMILPPLASDPESARPWFSRLRALLEGARERHPGLPLRHLSMGMSGDFEVAIEEGATMVRVGRALFGERAGPATP